MNSELLLIIPTATDLAERIRGVSNDLLTIANDLVAALDQNPRFAEELQACGINKTLTRRLERLGRGQIHPNLVFATTPGGMKLISVPLSEQELALSNGIEVLDDDEVTTRNIPVHELTANQAALVIAGGRIRTLAEQRTVIRDVKGSKRPVERDVDFKVLKDHVLIAKPGKFSKALILQWLTEMN